MSAHLSHLLLGLMLVGIGFGLAFTSLFYSLRWAYTDYLDEKEFRQLLKESSNETKSK